MGKILNRGSVLPVDIWNFYHKLYEAKIRGTEMKDYQPESYLLYDRPYNVRIRIELKEAVDGKLLSEAADRVIKRYPYFSVCVTVNKEGKYVIEPNHRPFVVSETRTPNFALGSEEVNFHMASIDYTENIIFFNVSHSLAGACGIMPWVKSVLYQYMTEKYQLSLYASGVNLPDSELLPGETAFPAFENLPEVEPFAEYKGGSGYFLTQDYREAAQNPGSGGNGYYCMEIQQSELMQYVRANDASPGTIISVFMFKALDSLFSPEIPVITCGMAHNFRDLAGCPNTYEDLTRTLHIKYTRDMADWSTEKLGTITRGMVMVQSQAENAIYDLKKLMEYHNQIDSIPTLEKKREFCRTQGKFIGAVRDTFNVSYVGRSDWGSLEAYMKSVYTVTNGHLNVEINSCNDKFFLCFHQVVDNKGYFEAFRKVLDEEGISYQVTGFFERNLPGTQLPVEDTKQKQS